LGLRFPPGWIVYSLWGATGWLTLDGKLIRESLFPAEQMQHDPSHLTSIDTLNGALLESVDLRPDAYVLLFSTETHRLELSLRRDGGDLPVWRGNGRPKVFAEHEEIENAIIISRIARLWLWQ
jgi:hypothetical protein